jgi:hypothetical protein
VGHQLSNNDVTNIVGATAMVASVDENSFTSQAVCVLGGSVNVAAGNDFGLACMACANGGWNVFRLETQHRETKPSESTAKHEPVVAGVASI